jgi:hypothetical protein
VKGQNHPKSEQAQQHDEGLIYAALALGHRRSW